jgi:poly(hydroxyalkanoate) granule-associated protein
MPEKKTKSTKTVEETPKRRSQLLHDIWLVGLGTVAVTGEGAVTLCRYLREKGEAFEGRHKDSIDGAKKRAVEVGREAKERVGTGYRKVSGKVEERVSSTLSRVGIGRSEIGVLRERVDELSEKIDQLKPELAN